MTSNKKQKYELERAGACWKLSFEAYASPCEVLMDCSGQGDAECLSKLAHAEALRLERKFSRYRDDNIVHQINSSQGRPVTVDQETARILDYAAQCYQLSDGAFDITSGVLRKAWKFDGREHTPDKRRIKQLLSRVGWRRVAWMAPEIRLEPGMEIDLGGVVKEYAVDLVAEMLAERLSVPLMVNFGGDIRAIDPDGAAKSWKVGIEAPDRARGAAGSIDLSHGGVATSGDSYRCCFHNGIRYGHIIDPRTGWPPKGAPRSVTVFADRCTSAGLLATLTVLQASEAENFLQAQGVAYSCLW